MIPGDLVTVTSNAGFEALLIPITITADIDENSNLVTGDMDGGNFSAKGYAEGWNHGRQQGGRVDFNTDDVGGYTADFSSSYDIWTGDWINVWYIDQNGNHLGRENVALRIEAVYSDDSLYVETAPFAQVSIKTTGGFEYTGQASKDGWMWTWDDNSLWLPSQPDIQPGDTITVEVPGHTAMIDPVGTIEGILDIVENTASGTINAPAWTGQDLVVNCNIWMPGGPGLTTSASADHGAYLCNFDDAGWDLQPMDKVGVYYFEPDGDAVARSFMEYYKIFLPLVRR
jgi:hypothetical protein